MEKKEKENYGKTLLDLRKSCGLTQKEVSERSGVAIAIISKIESGNYDARISTCLKIEQALNLGKIYTNKQNNAFMNTKEQKVSYLSADSNREEFHNVVKTLPCFKMATVSEDKSFISCLWDEKYENKFSDDDEIELMDLLYKRGWYNGEPTEHTEEEREHMWGFYCGKGEPVNLEEVGLFEFYAMTTGTMYEVDSVPVEFYEDFKRMKEEMKQK